MASAGIQRDSAPWTMLAIVLAVPLLALGAWALVVLQPNASQAAGATDPVVADVVRPTDQQSTEHVIEVVTADGAVVRSAVSGLLTGAPTVGTTLSAGDVAAKIDGMPVKAYTAEAPLWRALAVGDTGSDVGDLQRYLGALGYLDGEADDTFGGRTASAVARFNADSGQGPWVSTFDPASVVWIGPGPLQVADVPVSAGSLVVAGDVLLIGPPVPTSVDLVASESGGSGGSGESSGSGAPPRVTLPDGELTLTIDDVTVPFNAAVGRIVDPDDVALIVAAIAPATKATATLTTVATSEVAVVPASAIVQGASGAVCVYAAPGSHPVIVQAVGGSVSTVQLAADISLTRVLVNPNTVTLTHACGS